MLSIFNNFPLKRGTCAAMCNVSLCCAPSLSLSSSPSPRRGRQAMMLWHVLRSSKLQHIGALEVHTAPLARHARCNTWTPTPSTKCCCRSSQAAGEGSRSRGRVCKSGLQKFSVARLLRFLRSRTLSIGICTMKTLEFPFLFFFCSSSSLSRRVEYRRGYQLGVVWTFWFKNNGSRAACKTKSVLSFNYSAHKSLKEGLYRGSGGEGWSGQSEIVYIAHICAVVSARLKTQKNETNDSPKVATAFVLGTALIN